MKKLAICLLVCWTAAQVNAAEWLTDLPEALAKAKTEKKLVLMEFTGSDWCPPCKLLHEKVLTSKEFETYADKNLILVEVDFPNKKPQSAALKAANEALGTKFKIEGYPTVILLNADGKELNKDMGYSGASPAEFIAGLEKAKKQG